MWTAVDHCRLSVGQIRVMGREAEGKKLTEWEVDFFTQVRTWSQTRGEGRNYLEVWRRGLKRRGK